MRAAALDGTAETFALALTEFKGAGTYELGSPPPVTSPTLTGPGYVEWLRYDASGTPAAYVSASAAPVRLHITRYDRAQRLIAGEFAGELRAPDGQTVAIESGSFDVRYTAPLAKVPSHNGNR